MVFSSFTFLVYFLPLSLLLYLLCPAKWRNIFLLFASIVFYSWGAPRFIFVILGTTALDFYLVQLMSGKTGFSRRIWLGISVTVNLSLLFYFKYFNFFIENINGVFSLFGHDSVRTLKIVLPIGISFYTFESITYSVDVYRRIHAPLRSFWNYQLYILLFPKLIAGPIVRYHEIAEQISDRSAQETADLKLKGLFRFAIGLAKKVLIANTMAVYANDAFQMQDVQVNSSVAWIGMLSYTFQIYFDFSGYSDMAIGLGNLFGFRLPENFNCPYSSKSVTEFWRRWHITLGNWMRNYLYIPLGGNRKGRVRTSVNLLIVFFASGLWHGASWTFVLWGLYHGFFLVMERAGLERLLSKSGRVISTLITFLIVAVGWILFRAENLERAWLFFRELFTFDFGWLRFPADRHFIVYFALAVIFSFINSFNAGKKIVSLTTSGELLNSVALRLACSVVLIYYCIAAIISGELNPFIYFRF